jgi:hypothetical protein
MSEIDDDLVHPNYGHVEVWDVRPCADMSSAFFTISNSVIELDRLDLSFWDTRNMTTMARAFQYAKYDVVVSTWDVRNVKDMTRMFANTENFNGDVKEWDVGNVLSMYEMFREAAAFNGDVTWWNVGLVTDMSYMFYYALDFEGKGVSEWEAPNVETVYNMFEGATNANQEALEWQQKASTLATKRREWKKKAGGTKYGRARCVRPRRGFV